MRLNAIYVWPDAHWAPVGLAFVEGPAASALPADLQGTLLVASASPAFTTGPQRHGKAIQVFRLNAEGQPTAPPTLFGRYIGEGRGTIVDLKLQPDGLYFTELFFDGGDGGPIAPGGRVWRIRYTGDADFAASETSGPAPLTVAFTDRSTRLGANRWQWAFGDGEQSEEQSPRHTFARPGRYAVRLLVTGADGQPAERLQGDIDGGEWRGPRRPRAGGSSPPTPAVIAFPEMGTMLGGGFKHFWEQHGGLGQFGYPLTQELGEVNPADGREYTVQYFERARFEYHPEHAGTPYETQLGLVGRQAIAGREAEPPFQPVAGPGDDDARYVDVTGHTLRGVFREQWETTGGVDLYGLPISGLRGSGTPRANTYLVSTSSGRAWSIIRMPPSTSPPPANGTQVSSADPRTAKPSPLTPPPSRRGGTPSTSRPPYGISELGKMFQGRVCGIIDAGSPSPARRERGTGGEGCLLGPTPEEP
jgi:PKD repeat protein